MSGGLVVNCLFISGVNSDIDKKQEEDRKLKLTLQRVGYQISFHQHVISERTTFMSEPQRKRFYSSHPESDINIRHVPQDKELPLRSTFHSHFRFAPLSASEFAVGIIGTVVMANLEAVMQCNAL